MEMSTSFTVLFFIPYPFKNSWDIRSGSDNIKAPVANCIFSHLYYVIKPHVATQKKSSLINN